MRIRLTVLGSLLFVVALCACSGTPPKNTGVIKGQLAECPDSPNCVGSQAAPHDERHFVSPLTYSGSRSEAYQRLLQLIERQPHATVIRRSEDYLYAEFRSDLFGFVDDVEFYFPDSPVIHVRSASRLGYSDLGVNRKRIERIRATLPRKP